jgi:hypothetical protein
MFDLKIIQTRGDKKIFYYFHQLLCRLLLCLFAKKQRRDLISIQTY